MKNSILLFGGSSEERLVSVASAQNLVQNYSFSQIWYINSRDQVFKISKEELIAHKNPFENEFAPKPKPFADHIKKTLSDLKEQILFLGFHGTEGEDGTLQTLFEESQIKFTGSGAMASRNAFDKDKAKKMASKNGLKVAPQMLMKADNLVRDIEDLKAFFKQHQKIVIKPLANGSSIGLHIVSTQESLDKAIQSITTENYAPYICEKFIQGREMTVGLFGSAKDLKLLPPSEVVLKEGHSFDYKGKYLGRGTTEVTPADLSASEVKVLHQMAKAAHEVIGCYGYSRTDIILSSNGPVFIEINTLPGLSKASFIPQQLAAAGIRFEEFIQSQLVLAERRR